jgi:D-alanine-D-alanine ligase-like ATP-grasp enzyme
MLHVLSPKYDPGFDRIGRSLQEIAVCSQMLQDDWKKDLLKNLADSGFDAIWHDVSLSNYRSLAHSFNMGDMVWLLIDGIETDGYPGSTVIGYIDGRRTRFGLRVIGPGLDFYSQDKPAQKSLLMENRINTPGYFIPEDDRAAAACFRFLFKDKSAPYIIKPFDLYCSVGIEKDSVVDNEGDAVRVYERLKARTPNIIIEQFIRGREFTVLCIGNEKGIVVYPPVERVFHAAGIGMGFMDFSMTQVLHGDHLILEMKGVSDPALVREIEDLSRRAFNAVGAEAYVRIDIRLDTSNGLLYILEVNPCPSVGLESSIEEILNISGISFEAFFRDLLNNGVSSGASRIPLEDKRFQ